MHIFNIYAFAAAAVDGVVMVWMNLTNASTVCVCGSYVWTDGCFSNQLPVENGLESMETKHNQSRKLFEMIFTKLLEMLNFLADNGCIAANVSKLKTHCWNHCFNHDPLSLLNDSAVSMQSVSGTWNTPSCIWRALYHQKTKFACNSTFN